MRTTILFAAIFLASAGACADEMYKCMIDGKVRYTDSPCGKQEATQVINGGKSRKRVAREEKPSDTILDIHGDKDDPNRVTGSFSLSGDNFECNDPAYAKVDKVTSFKLVTETGSKQLCRKKEVQQK